MHDVESFALNFLQKNEGKRGKMANLLDAIPYMSPWLESPYWLKELADLLDRSLEEPVKAVVSVPPQHGKSTLVLHHLVRLQYLKPAVRSVYVSYGADFSKSQEQKAEAVLTELEIPMKQITQRRWVTHSRSQGGVFWTGVGGELVGNPVDGVLIIDDPYKGRQQAESPAYRRMLEGWWTGSALTRIHEGSSIIIVQTRWTDDDFAGKRAEEEGWEVINIPVWKHTEEEEDPTPLWPEAWPLPYLKKRKVEVGEYDWSSLYLGRPQPRGTRVFRDIYHYDKLPEEAYQRYAGADWAYTESTRADRSVAVDAIIYEGKIYIINMIAGHWESPVFISQLHRLNANRILTSISGTEKSVVQYANQALMEAGHPHRVHEDFKVLDKFTAAQPLIQLWNDGKVLVPDPNHYLYDDWVEDFTNEILSFTGAKGNEKDDVVDATIPLARRTLGTMSYSHLERLSGRVPSYRRPGYLPRRED